MKKGNILSMIVAVFMVLALMPISVSTVYAVEADIISPTLELETLCVTYPEGKIAVTAGETVTVSMSVADEENGSGIGTCYICYKMPITGKTKEDFFRYNAENGKVAYSKEIDEVTEPGIWQVKYIKIYDNSRNVTELYDRRSYPTTADAVDLSAGDFVVEGTNPDTTSPTLELETLCVTYPEGKTAVTAGETVTVNMSVADEENGSGIGTCYICYKMPITGKTKEDFFRYNAENGKVAYSKEIDEVTESGIWQVKYIKIYDNSRNVTELYDRRSYPTTADAVDLSAGDFTVTQNCKITFNTNGGSQIDPQYVIPGENATKPDDPSKGGSSWQGGADFGGWYSDEELTEEFNFNKPINEDITLYAKWYRAFSICNYDITNHTDESGGKYMTLREGEPDGRWMQYCMNMTLAEGDKLTLKAQNNTGYIFLGWFKGVYTGSSSGQAAEPRDITDPENLISTETTYVYTCTDYQVICPVFEVCTNHQWEQKIQKATPDADGCIYQGCSICGEEETVAPILMVSNIKLERTSFDYTGKAIEPKVTVANEDEELTADCYTVEYSNNVNAGTAIAKVTLKGDYYEGSKMLTFNIIDSSSEKPVAPAVKVGGQCSYGGQQYVVKSLPSGSAPGEVVFKAAINAKKVTVPEEIKLADGKTYNVIAVDGKAFKGKKIRTVTIGKNVKKINKYAFRSSKATRMIVKTKLLNKAAVSGSLKGSKIKIVQVKVGAKSLNKKYVKIYKKIFTKKNAGKKATVK